MWVWPHLSACRDQTTSVFPVRSNTRRRYLDENVRLQRRGRTAGTGYDGGARRKYEVLTARQQGSVVSFGERGR